MNRVADLPFTPASVGFASWLINGGGNGYTNRQQFAKYLANVLFDEPTLVGRVTFQYPPLSPAGSPSLCATFPPATVQWTMDEVVDYEPQVP
jgi:hypothetical protein